MTEPALDYTGDSPLSVYIDFKSPYAYLAIEPTRRMARELGIKINWLPFVLDIPSFLGSARLDKNDKVIEQARKQEQWSWVKYAYYDCRRYANLRGMIIRGTTKIWDTSLAATGMLWASRQGEKILHRYIDGVYIPFWKRELDVESFAVVQDVLSGAGASLKGFESFAAGEGARQNQLIQENSFAQGIFGVPTYVTGDAMYFGREHLPRIRWQLQGRHGPAPDIAYELLPTDTVEAAACRELEVGICLQDPDSYLAIRQVLDMARELDLAISWYELPPKPYSSRPDPDDLSRGARHRRFRFENRQRDLRRYQAPELEGGDIATVTGALMEQNGISLQEGEMSVTWARKGYVSSPIFSLGEETFMGRQHLPLIRARLEKTMC